MVTCDLHALSCFELRAHASQAARLRQPSVCFGSSLSCPCLEQRCSALDTAATCAGGAPSSGIVRLRLMNSVRQCQT